jgi:hypothetical protein
MVEAITILRNESNNHRLLQIDLSLLAGNEELLKDVYDTLAIELGKNEENCFMERGKTKLFLAETCNLKRNYGTRIKRSPFKS